MGCCESICIAAVAKAATEFVDKITAACCCPNTPPTSGISINIDIKNQNENNEISPVSSSTRQASVPQPHASQATGHDSQYPARQASIESTGHLIAAQDLTIEHSDNPVCWSNIDDPRYPAGSMELNGVHWLQIETTTAKSKNLAANTQYGVYLKYQIMPNSQGLNTKLIATVAKKQKFVYLTEQQEGRDGWREVKLGEFNTSNGQAKVILVDPDNGKKEIAKEKAGLIIAGIEFRPV